MPRQQKKTEAVPCRLIAWSLNKDEQIRAPMCPECFQPAEVGLDMIGRPCYYHKKSPSFPFAKNRAKP